MSDDPLIEAMERRLREQQERERAKRHAAARENVTETIHSARDKWWRPKTKVESPLFAYTSERVIHEGVVGYASYVYMPRSGVWTIDEESVKVHKTRVDAIDRAYDMYCGFRVARGLKLPADWGANRQRGRK